MNRPNVDRAITEFDHALRTVFGIYHARRPSPARTLPEREMSDSEREHAAALMRVNHVGEVCAQALYQGQALAARDEGNRSALQAAAAEEQDHLAWSAERIRELGGRTSLLNPVWYASSLAMGLAAGALGDRWSLAFLAETERQVEVHLEGHLAQIPETDGKTRAVVNQMRVEEGAHRATAESLGAAEMPEPARRVMQLLAKVMTTVAYRL